MHIQLAPSQAKFDRQATHGSRVESQFINIQIYVAVECLEKGKGAFWQFLLLAFFWHHLYRVGILCSALGQVSIKVDPVNVQGQAE